MVLIALHFASISASTDIFLISYLFLLLRCFNLKRVVDDGILEDETAVMKIGDDKCSGFPNGGGVMVKEPKLCSPLAFFTLWFLAFLD